MAKDAIDLESVRIHYDRRDGAFRLTSADSRLRGKPFQLTLSKDSKSVESLLELFRTEGIIDQERDSNFPARVDLNSLGYFANGLDEYTIAGKERPLWDSRLGFPLGLRYDEFPVTIDLAYAAHTLITGAPGYGKTELLIGLAEHAVREGRAVRILDPIGEKLAGRIPGIGAAAVSGPNRDGTAPMVNQVIAELRRRLTKLRETEAPNSVAYEARFGAMAPLFFFANSIERTSNENGWIEEILNFGEQVGIYLFATTPSSFDLPRLSDEAALLNFGRRVLVGPPQSPNENSFGISPRLLKEPGRGVLKTYDSKPLVLQLLAGTESAS